MKYGQTKLYMSFVDRQSKVMALPIINDGFMKFYTRISRWLLIHVIMEDEGAKFEDEVQGFIWCQGL